MVNNRKVVAWVPYGRERTVSILINYFRRDVERGLIDEVWLYLNTDADQVSDLRYAYQLKKKYSFIQLKERPAGRPVRKPKQRSTGYAYEYMTDPDTVYLRFDDDIVYVHEDAVQNLVETKISMDSAFACFPIIWNNAICSYFLQKHGKLPLTWGEVKQAYCMDSVGWGNGYFAVGIHNFLLEKIRNNNVESVYLYQDIPLAPRQQFSVSCFAVDGKDYCELSPPGVLDFPEEEAFHTIHRPQKVGKTNFIVGNALVSHFSFYPQHSVLNPTDVLDQYRVIAEKV